MGLQKEPIDVNRKPGKVKPARTPAAQAHKLGAARRRGASHQRTSKWRARFLNARLTSWLIRKGDDCAIRTVEYNQYAIYDKMRVVWHFDRG